MVSVVQLSWTWSHWYLAQRARKSSKMATNQGENCQRPALFGVFCGFFGWLANRSSEKVSSSWARFAPHRYLEIYGYNMDIYRYIYIWCNLPFYSIHPSTKSLKCAAVAQWRSAGTYYDLYCYSEYYRPPPPPGHQTGSDGLEWCSPLEFRDDGGNS